MYSEKSIACEKTCSSNPWTVSMQAAASKLKPVKLLELGENERGRFVRVELEDESARPLYLKTMEDAWHRFFEPLGSECQMAIGRFFRTLEAVSLPNGHTKSFDLLSFMSVTRSKRGAVVSSCGFDNEPMPHFDGMIQGLEFAREFMSMKKCVGSRVRLASVIQDLADALSDNQAKSGNASRSRSNAAFSFVHALDAVIGFAAQNADFNDFFDRCIADHEKSRAFFDELDRKKRAEFVARMKASKAPKASSKALGDELETA